MKKITLTIGIPAFNEEQNIKTLLSSIKEQQLSSHFTIKEVIVYSDASTDTTDAIVKSMHKATSWIRLLKSKRRMGKYYRMNELFAMNKSDILIIMDADIAMVGKRFLEVLAMSLVKDQKALVVSAKNIFIRPKGFIANILYRHFTIWDIILPNLLNESSLQFLGTVTAFRGSYARNLRIPANVQNPHLYLYLAAISQKGFRYCKEAQILQYPPATLHEVKAVLVRKIMQPDKMLERIFGEQTIRSLDIIPTKAKIHAVGISFIEDPFYTPLALLMKVYLGRVSQHLKSSTSQIWEINKTTKREISYEK